MYNVEEELTRYVTEIGGRIVGSPKQGEEIRKTRIAFGITQEEMGELVKLRRETISRIENGSISPTMEFVRKFARVIALARVVRDMQAMREVQNLGSFSPNLLRGAVEISQQDFELISRIGIRGYQKSRAKILEKIKSEV